LSLFFGEDAHHKGDRLDCLARHRTSRAPLLTWLIFVRRLRAIARKKMRAW